MYDYSNCSYAGNKTACKVLLAIFPSPGVVGVVVASDEGCMCKAA
jgi:hypothetical protein